MVLIYYLKVLNLFYFHLGDFESFLHRLRPLIPNDSEIIHPKLIELRKQIMQHLEEKGTDDCKIFIRLFRHSDVIAPRIHAIMTAAGIECIVDPRICRFGGVAQTFHGGQTVIVAEKISSDFPCNLLSLIINYERPSSAIPHLSTVPQLTLDVHRPVFGQDQKETTEMEDIPVCSLTSSCTSSSPQSYGSSPNPENLMEVDAENESEPIPADAEKLQSPIQKDSTTEMAVHSNPDSEPAEIVSDPVRSPTKLSFISEPIETQIDCNYLNTATLEYAFIREATVLPMSIVNTSLQSDDVMSSSAIDTTTLYVNSQPIETHRTGRILPIICSSRLKQNIELTNAISAKDLQIHEFDYS